jgi:cobalt/nickel transport system ATP-binding protein
LFNPTVFDEVAFGPLQLRWARSRVLDAVHEILDRMEIRHLKDRPPHRLSGGETKRVAMASVLVLDPEILLLDQPTASLDPRSESMMVELLSTFGADRTVVMATHDLSLVSDLADHCFVLCAGKVIDAGEPRSILRNSELLDRANLIHAHRHRHESGLVHSHPHAHPHDHAWPVSESGFEPCGKPYLPSLGRDRQPQQFRNPQGRKAASIKSDLTDCLSRAVGFHCSPIIPLKP